MTPYQIDITRKALKQLAECPKRVQHQIKLKIEALANDPRPVHSKKLKGYPNLYRIRVGDYRVIYEIQGDLVRITILIIGHRQSVYK